MPTAEKLAIFDIIDDVVENGEYVGSGKYIPHGAKAKNAVRYDYFETPVAIDGNKYLATFDVEVVPGKNNYRTHRVINEINLTQIPSGEVGPVPTAQGNVLGLSTFNIPQQQNLVNSGKMAKNANETQKNTRQIVKTVDVLADNNLPLNNKNENGNIGTKVVNANEVFETARRNEVRKNNTGKSIEQGNENVGRTSSSSIEGWVYDKRSGNASMEDNRGNRISGLTAEKLIGTAITENDKSILFA